MKRAALIAVIAGCVVAAGAATAFALVSAPDHHAAIVSLTTPARSAVSSPALVDPVTTPPASAAPTSSAPPPVAPTTPVTVTHSTTASRTVAKVATSRVATYVPPTVPPLPAPRPMVATSNEFQVYLGYLLGQLTFTFSGTPGTYLPIDVTFSNGLGCSIDLGQWSGQASGTWSISSCPGNGLIYERMEFTPTVIGYVYNGVVAIAFNEIVQQR